MSPEDAPTGATAPTAEDCPRADGMPMLGLGTWQLSDPETCKQTVREALEMGYRHVDTARNYGNEAHVGDGIEAAAVDRDEVFLATKIWPDDLSYDAAIDAAYESLSDLGVDYIDLLYVHWPAGEYDPEETLQAFAELEDEGVIERVGVSNFEPEQIAEAVDYADVDIFANQIECHPLCQQRDVREACAERDIEVVAYSPLARGRVMNEPTINEIATDNNVSPAQVSLAWLREKGMTPIPKSASVEHLRDNWESLSVQLNEGEIEKLDELERHERTIDPDFAPWN